MVGVVVFVFTPSYQLFCCFSFPIATVRKDNPIAHGVQWFSHLLNQFWKFQRNLLLSQ
jgi:hypothetical protein